MVLLSSVLVPTVLSSAVVPRVLSDSSSELSFVSCVMLFGIGGRRVLKPEIGTSNDITSDRFDLVTCSAMGGWANTKNNTNSLLASRGYVPSRQDGVQSITGSALSNLDVTTSSCDGVRMFVRMQLFYLTLWKGTLRT